MSAVDYEVAASLGRAIIHEAAGPAFTVNCPEGDNLWLHRAIYAAAPGDVLVLATGDVVP